MDEMGYACQEFSVISDSLPRINKRMCVSLFRLETVLSESRFILKAGDLSSVSASWQSRCRQRHFKRYQLHYWRVFIVNMHFVHHRCRNYHHLNCKLHMVSKCWQQWHRHKHSLLSFIIKNIICNIQNSYSSLSKTSSVTFTTLIHHRFIFVSVFNFYMIFFSCICLKRTLIGIFIIM